VVSAFHPRDGEVLDVGRYRVGLRLGRPWLGLLRNGRLCMGDRLDARSKV